MLKVEFRPRDRSRDGLLDYDPVQTVKDLDRTYGDYSGGYERDQTKA
jgi:hypothetical protein